MKFMTMVVLICVYLVLRLMHILTGTSILELLSFWTNKFLDLLTRRSSKRYQKNDERFSVMSRKEKRASKKYRFYAFVNEILLDLSWKSRGITVEGFQIFLELLASVLAIIVALLFQSLIMGIAIGLIGLILLYAIVFLLSRLNHSARKTALMDAEDFLCSSMSGGLVQSVEENVNMMDPLIQPVFKEFLDAVYNRNVDIYTAIDKLNDSCGEQFDDFCDKCKSYERERKPGMEDIFQYNIARNSYIKELDRECSKVFSKMNKDYFACLGIILGFVIYNMMAYAEMRDFYFSSLGRVLIVVYFTSVSIVFIYLQFIQSKPFRYGKK